MKLIFLISITLIALAFIYDYINFNYEILEINLISKNAKYHHLIIKVNDVKFWGKTKSKKLNVLVTSTKGKIKLSHVHSGKKIERLSVDFIENFIISENDYFNVESVEV